MVHSHICCYPPFSQPLARPEAWACARMLVPCATTAVDNYMSYEIELWATTFSMRCGSWCIIKAYHWTLGLHLRGFKALWSRINIAFSEAYILASTKFKKEYLVLDRSGCFLRAEGYPIWVSYDDQCWHLSSVADMAGCGLAIWTLV